MLVIALAQREKRLRHAFIMLQAQKLKSSVIKKYDAKHREEIKAFKKGIYVLTEPKHRPPPPPPPAYGPVVMIILRGNGSSSAIVCVCVMYW